MDDNIQLNSTYIFNTKLNAIRSLHIENQLLVELQKKLKLYKHVSNPDELEEGMYIRWINKSTHKLYNGGIICSFSNIVITCKNPLNRFFSLNLNDNIIFRKLTEDEIYIISLLK